MADIDQTQIVKIHTGGPQFILKDPDEAADLCQAYFQQMIELDQRPTMAGLALHLGFASRQSLYDYLERDNAVSYVIQKAMLALEDFHERRLSGSQQCVGSIFWLKNRGWVDRTELVHSSANKFLEDLQGQDTPKQIDSEIVDNDPETPTS
jgi:hypothetical protein